VVIATLSVVLTGSAANISDQIGAVSFGDGTHMVACAGREIAVTDAGASDIEVLCDYGVRRLGTAQTFVAAEAGTARTTLPAGTTAGTLLISSVADVGFVHGVDEWLDEGVRLRGLHPRPAAGDVVARGGPG
jgi:hypothetical protein